VIATLVRCYGDRSNPIFFSEAHGTLISSSLPFQSAWAYTMPPLPYIPSTLKQKIRGDTFSSWELRDAGGFLPFIFSFIRFYNKMCMF